MENITFSNSCLLKAASWKTATEKSKEQKIVRLPIRSLFTIRKVQSNLKRSLFWSNEITIYLIKTTPHLVKDSFPFVQLSIWLVRHKNRWRSKVHKGGISEIAQNQRLNGSTKLTASPKTKKWLLLCKWNTNPLRGYSISFGDHNSPCFHLNSCLELEIPNKKSRPHRKCTIS